MAYQGTKQLEQDVFKNQPKEVDWCGVDYDGLLKFGKATSPRYTWASERWRGFEEINRVENSGYKALTSLKRQ